MNAARNEASQAAGRSLKNLQPWLLRWRNNIHIFEGLHFVLKVLIQC